MLREHTLHKTDNRKEQRKIIDTYMTFIYLEQSYDTVLRCKIWQAIRKLNIKKNLIKGHMQTSEPKSN